MENLNLALVSSPKPLLLGHSSSKNVFSGRKSFTFGTFRVSANSSSSHVTRAASKSHQNLKSVQGKVNAHDFASISSSNGQETTSVGVSPQLSPPPPSTVGSPLFWIGIGVGFSALFSVVASRVKKYAMQQAFKSMMGQMNTQNNPFDSGAFSSGPPFPFPMPSASGPATPAGFAGNQSQATSTRSASQSTVTVDIPATKVEAAAPAPDINVKEEVEVKNEPKKSAFVDVSPEETVQKNAFERFKDVDESSSFKEARAPAEASQNGTPFKQGFGDSPSSPSERKSALSVDALEKMMEDPTVQQMVYPYLPEEMRNPSTFKWMMQNPEYRQQLEAMLNNMGGGTEWDSRMMDTLKNFDLNSPDVKQQFDQIGLSPQEVISKIMANPDVAMAFQNPRVQAAIMDCSQNPMSIVKYQNDKEVMDVFNKISELFPGVSGPP
uniref:Protein TIC 40, chloroplastic n=1 Tax=Pisum sativum TaxID=3888 RepID=TIC40_PEA|nr:RecName: Full=Protein TIC 40, chloroplastic; AltName: Full=Translocon at the inner envelope membrane of chloroplasts 40; Short=PsTIC40; Flags: Precursor [Pisum sativum]AAN75219.1 chloroplast protein translocon component Tic40 precursor [Pisum sativum]